MKATTITFDSPTGYKLTGIVELPSSQKPHNFVIFAHCFTCSKDLTPVRIISRELTSQGFGVLRFDFTGLGASHGDFADTTFSSNVDDLLAAVEYLEEHYQAPSLLIGHSLGGAAAIFASAKANSIKAVATIGTPSDVKHVKHLFADKVEEIESKGNAKVQLAGREFTISSDFVKSLNENHLTQVLQNLRKPVLIMHSPQDDYVSIKHAEKLYVNAWHPKSFISLDSAHHLLMNKKDSSYTGRVIAAWALRYLNIPEKQSLKSEHEIVASLKAGDDYTTSIKAGDHYITADEPLSVGGNNFGPTPYELVSSGLAACTVMTLHMYARRKQWPLDHVECHVSYSKEHAADCEHCEENSAKIDTFKRGIKITGDLDEKQIDRLLQIADKCPVHRTLHSETQVITNRL
ncbi:osmotically inducible protein C [Nonlabens tegetincola]|uniref:bifunctional alpha/beta hydrolase/OsmC family protein n=1 Tax=Nonlabens tegetincola TaxID=323273 RepID=UPI000A2065F6|nr:bifunctional alpha/beta hydrolase/OsmC family protein [Nonlabens tegetincola]ARN71000.1 osmotically inducible protein C [Nonlabens tegetincola]